ncbi:hypothetical protein ACFV1W_09410 [Kitasatospora sp. NPDC059648]|uniref:hypothetical protein n=1 Tax=Kitasatospora sp. NPDC059648 TaxID=3346894 RepID=UPI0036880DBF
MTEDVHNEFTGAAHGMAAQARTGGFGAPGQVPGPGEHCTGSTPTAFGWASGLGTGEGMLPDGGDGLAHELHGLHELVGEQ